jgi:Raf kinase inhibitor-like YbhB/YbcL family protein
MTRTVAVALVTLVLASASIAACGGSTAKNTHALDAIDVTDDIKVTSPAFTDGGAIPRADTCDGPGTEPTITWDKVPAATKTVAVVVSDPDAPGGDFLHWLVIGLPPTSGSIPSRSAGVTELDNTGGTRGWTAPCPPTGSTHHYRFTVYALNDYVCADNGDTSNGPGCSAPSSVQALSQIAGTAIAKGVLIGMFGR